MNLFKKLFALVFIFMSFALVACSEKEKEDESNVFEEVASELLKDVDKTKVTENLELVKELNGVTIEWKSDNEAVISNEGVVTRGEDEEVVTLTVTLKKGEETQQFDILIIVPAKEKEDSSYQKVEDALKGTVGATYEVKGVVAAVNAQSFLLSDATGYILVYKGYGWSADVEAGDEVVVNGITTTYAGANQFDKTCTYEKKGTKGFVAPEAKELDGAKVTEIAGKTGTTVEYVKVKGTLNVSSDDKYFNLTIAGTENIGSITYPADVDFVKGFNGQEIEVTGFYTGISGGKYFNIMYTKINGESAPSAPTPDEPVVPTPEVPSDAITVSEAIELAKKFGDVGSTEEYYVVGKVVKISNPQYGEMYITDGVNEIYVYGATGIDGTYFNKLEDKPYAGDDVVLCGVLKMYNDEPEMGRSKIISFTHNEVEFDEESYKESTIANAREAAENEKLKVTGVVAFITYANGFIPNGFYLVDETGAMYIYGDQIAPRLKVGNTVTICGEKTYYVLSTEISYAEKFGYKGCCQLQNPYLISNDNKVTDFNKNWIEETTVKEILDTPVTSNITTNIYKVNALVKKVPGSGFVNYYINDLDGETGSYTYTSCNGGDFEWLDKFDGKICTVYLAAHNCKSTVTDCFYRFIPILVEDNNFKFDTKDASEFAVKYYGVDQFLAEYANDPALELVKFVSSTLLQIENVELQYSSSDETVVYFENGADNVIMHTGAAGTAVIKIKADYAGVSYEETIEITVTKADDVETISIKEAFNAADDTKVTIKGVVISSLVNRSGFYIGDDTGLIAVICESTMFENIKIGNLIVIEGIRSHNKKDPAAAHAGQSYIKDSKLVLNYYGEHEYNTSYFEKDKTIEEISGYDVNVDYSCSVYVVQAKIEVEESTYYKNIYVKSLDGSVSIRLYSSSANQYSWMFAYAGKQVTLEIALCNWNDKAYYTGCVISATCDGVKTLNTLNFN